MIFLGLDESWTAFNSSSSVAGWGHRVHVALQTAAVLLWEKDSHSVLSRVKRLGWGERGRKRGRWKEGERLKREKEGEREK